jgi:hypothetical protein
MIHCQVCKKREAIWATQFIGENIPTFSLLGSHVRGFSVVKVCDVCKEINREGIFQKFVDPTGRAKKKTAQS